jgi:hypothetical protein
MRKARLDGIAVAALLTAVGVSLLAAAPAGAEVTSGCHASFAGRNIDGLPPDRAHAIVVGQNDIVPMTMSRPDGKRFTELDIYFLFKGFFRWDIYKAPAGGGTWSHPVDIHRFARFGVGLYDLLGVGHLADGTTCDGEVYIKVSGDPLDSIAGKVGVGATVAGVLGVLGAGLGAGGGGGDPEPPVTPDDVAKEEEHQKTRADVPEDYSPEDAADDASRGWCFLFSVLMIPLVLVLALLFGRSALAMGVVAAPAVKVRRRAWPLVVGPISGLLTGLGAGLLLQQYSIVYPTRTYAIVYVAGGIVFGLAVPLLRRSLSR